MTILVTGGAGFIGSNFVLDWLAASGEPVVNLDLLTYSGNLRNLEPLQADHRHVFVKGDIRDRQLVDALLKKHMPRAIVHFAAESHVDRSIQDPGSFVQTNILGTFSLLEAARQYWNGLANAAQLRFRFLHVSTDEVYGAVAEDQSPLRESAAYDPHNPYAASKASADHLVRAWSHTFGLPVLVTNSSNNYGPRQFPEKLVPLTIGNAISDTALPVYGDGCQLRDWLHVTDHCSALRLVLERGHVGQTYNIGGGNEQVNIEVVRRICRLLDELLPAAQPRERLINHVADRPGHDRRYALDAGKIERMLGWRPALDFENGLRATVAWYIDNPDWLVPVRCAD